SPRFTVYVGAAASDTAAPGGARAAGVATRGGSLPETARSSTGTGRCVAQPAMTSTTAAMASGNRIGSFSGNDRKGGIGLAALMQAPTAEARILPHRTPA